MTRHSSMFQPFRSLRRRLQGYTFGRAAAGTDRNRAVRPAGGGTQVGEAAQLDVYTALWTRLILIDRSGKRALMQRLRAIWATRRA